MLSNREKMRRALEKRYKGREYIHLTIITVSYNHWTNHFELTYSYRGIPPSTTLMKIKEEIKNYFNITVNLWHTSL
jgi:hypothetical protein